jgi:rSAM/selenodomain-associated transferase 2
MSDIAIIVPVLDDTAALRDLLRVVRAWPDQPGEIVVAPGASDVETERLCREHGCRLVVARPCRGAQLDAGARESSAALLWFLHADALPRAGSLEAIRAARAAGAEAGYFRFELDGERDLRRRILETAVRWRARCGGVPYGDQGLWMTREAYGACGGFAHEPLFEEVALVKRLRKRRPLAALGQALGVSPRRWDRDGWWRRSAKNRLLAIGHALGMPAARLAARYYPAQAWPEDGGS